MSHTIMYCNPNQCTGCLLCEMACSLLFHGVCAPEHSQIRILTHPIFGTSQPILYESCKLDSCEARCVQVCSQKAIQIAEVSQTECFLSDPEWNPVPILSTSGQGK